MFVPLRAQPGEGLRGLKPLPELKLDLRKKIKYLIILINDRNFLCFNDLNLRNLANLWSQKLTMTQ